MRDKIREALNSLKEKGEALNFRINKVSNTPELNTLVGDYELWNKTTLDILKKVFVHSQIYRMFEGPTYIGNVYVDANSFQGKRDRINHCLPPKLNHLTTALNLVNTAKEMDLLPIEDEVLSIIKNEPKTNPKMKKVFISHASIDANIIEPLVDLIEDIGVLHNQIFFSSQNAFGVGLGENIFERLKVELNNDVFALFILSPNFYNSPVCLCEMGAVWIKSHKQIPILIPPFEFNKVKGVFSESLGFKINDKDQLNSLKLELEEYFGLTPKHISRWEKKREEYLTKVNSLIS
jgi:hypothetical protein